MSAPVNAIPVASAPEATVTGNALSPRPNLVVASLPDIQPQPQLHAVPAIPDFLPTLTVWLDQRAKLNNIGAELDPITRSEVETCIESAVNSVVYKALKQDLPNTALAVVAGLCAMKDKGRGPQNAGVIEKILAVRAPKEEQGLVRAVIAALSDARKAAEVQKFVLENLKPGQQPDTLMAARFLYLVQHEHPDLVPKTERDIWAQPQAVNANNSSTVSVVPESSPHRTEVGCHFSDQDYLRGLNDADMALNIAACETNMKYPKLLSRVAQYESDFDPQAKGRDKHDNHVVAFGLMQFTPGTIFYILKQYEPQMRALLSKPAYGNYFKAVFDWLNGPRRTDDALWRGVLGAMDNPQFSAYAGAINLIEKGANTNPFMAWINYVSPAMGDALARQPENSTATAREIAQAYSIPKAVLANNPTVFGNGNWTKQQIIAVNIARFHDVVPAAKKAATRPQKKPAAHTKRAAL